MRCRRVRERARLIHETQATVPGTQRAHDFVERLEIARDHPVVLDFAVALTLGDRDVNRSVSATFSEVSRRRAAPSTAGPAQAAVA